MINKVILVGNLTKDAEAVTTSGRSMTRFRLATNSRWRNADGIPQESVEFHSIVAFGQLAERTTPYCLRGQRVYIEGRLRTRQYQAADGTRRISTEIIAETLRLLGGHRESAGADVETHDDNRAEGTETPAIVAMSA